MDNNALGILIVEDNLSFSLELEMLLSELGYRILACVDNSAEALEAIYSLSPDLILMDVDIKGRLSGLEIGQNIKHLDIPIIYITSFNEREKYEAAKESNMAAYLVKPPNIITLESTIDTVARQKESFIPKTTNDKDGNGMEQFIFVKKNKTYHKVAIQDIHYVEAKGNYCQVQLEDKRMMSHLNLSKMSDLLPHPHFIQIHRSYIIHIDYFSSINMEENTVMMTNGDTLPLSRSHRKKLLQRLGLA